MSWLLMTPVTGPLASPIANPDAGPVAILTFLAL
jgi:hypothetical protein